jgi:hypothetical protein
MHCNQVVAILPGKIAWFATRHSALRAVYVSITNRLPGGSSEPGREIASGNFAGLLLRAWGEPLGARKGLEGCEAAPARSAGAGAVAESRKARFLARSAKNAPYGIIPHSGVFPIGNLLSGRSPRPVEYAKIPNYKRVSGQTLSGANPASV